MKEYQYVIVVFDSVRVWNGSNSVELNDGFVIQMEIQRLSGIKLNELFKIG